MPDRWFQSSSWWWCALAGFLLVLAFPPFACPTCGWVALVPAWLMVTRSERVRQKPMRHGYLIGLIYFGGTFWWISNVTALGTFCLVLYLAVYPAIWFLLVARLLPRGEGIGRIIFRAMAAAAFWVTLEWLRSWFLTGFDWNELGASQSPSIVFRQLAAFGGVPLISFGLVMVNILWAEGLLAMGEAFRRTKMVRVSAPFGAALFVVAICFALGWHHLLRHRGETKSAGFTYACVQPNIPQIADASSQKTEDAALAQEVSLSMQALKDKPGLLIWPEAILDEGVFDDEPLYNAAHSICMATSGYFLLGSQDFEMRARKLYNAAYLFSPDTEPQEYRKTRLVMLGEYLPFGNQFPQLRKWVGMGMDFSPGPAPGFFTLPSMQTSFAPLICFEDTLAAVPDRAMALHPDFFITITNDGWYTGWYAQWGIRQHLALAAFRCVEHDRPMIRCANTGVSCEIDQDGTVTDRLTDAKGRYIDVAGIFRHRLEFCPPHRTLYESWGNWIVLLSQLVSVMMVVYLFRRPAGTSRES